MTLQFELWQEQSWQPASSASSAAVRDMERQASSLHCSSSSNGSCSNPGPGSHAYHAQLPGYRLPMHAQHRCMPKRSARSSLHADNACSHSQTPAPIFTAQHHSCQDLPQTTSAHFGPCSPHASTSHHGSHCPRQDAFASIGIASVKSQEARAPPKRQGWDLLSALPDAPQLADNAKHLFSGGTALHVSLLYNAPQP